MADGPVGIKVAIGGPPRSTHAVRSPRETRNGGRLRQPTRGTEANAPAPARTHQFSRKPPDRLDSARRPTRAVVGGLHESQGGKGSRPSPARSGRRPLPAP